MKKLILISACALILSACSTSNQISISTSRYGNGVGISFGDGLSKTDQAKTDHKRAVVRDRAQHKRFIQNITLTQRNLKVIDHTVNASAQPVAINNIEGSVAENNTTTTKSLEENAVKEEKCTVQTEAIIQLTNKVATTNKKTLKKQARQLKKEGRKGLFDSDVALILLVILALILPPLAVYLYEGSITSRFWISLLLSLIFWVPGVIYALIVILGG
jgi:uncharacterized membrane protein YqaE (UPF0057 family)